MNRSRIAILGAGKVGTNLGANLAAHGFAVVFGLRDGRDGAAAVARCEGKASAAPLAEAVKDADVVFLTVPAGVALEAARAARIPAGRVLVDCTNPVGWAGGPVLEPPREGSVAALLANALPDLKVVKGFNTFGAEFHLDPRLDGAGTGPLGSVDVQLAGDDEAAKNRVAAIAAAAGFTPVDAGPLRNAALLESLAVLWIHLAVKGGRGRDIAFKLLVRTR